MREEIEERMKLMRKKKRVGKEGCGREVKFEGECMNGGGIGGKIGNLKEGIEERRMKMLGKKKDVVKNIVVIGIGKEKELLKFI